VCYLHIHKRSSGQYYDNWKIELYSGNDPKWFSRHRLALLKHIQEDYGSAWVRDIRIVGSH
jgi:hypothetical protein